MSLSSRTQLNNILKKPFDLLFYVRALVVPLTLLSAPDTANIFPANDQLTCQIASLNLCNTWCVHWPPSFSFLRHISTRQSWKWETVLQPVMICSNSIMFFNCYLAVSRLTLNHSWGGSITNPMLITAFV